MSSEDDVRLHLGDHLTREVGLSVNVEVQAIPNSTGRWKISTTCEASPFVINAKDAIPGCQFILPLSRFLGFNVIRELQCKNRKLSELVSDKLLLEFLIDANKPGFKVLAEDLRKHKMLLATNGDISIEHKQSVSTKKAQSAICRIINESIANNFSSFTTGRLTSEEFMRIVKDKDFQTLKSSNLVAIQITEDRKSSVTPANEISVSGLIKHVDNFKSKLEQIQKLSEKESREEREVRSCTVPNVHNYQLKVLELTGLFDRIRRKFPSVSITPDYSLHQVNIQCAASVAHAVQQQITDLLPSIEESRVSKNCSQSFASVFVSEQTQAALNAELHKRGISAAWLVNNLVLSVYSESRSVSEAALSVVESIVVEFEKNLDEKESKVIDSADWNKQLEELCDQFKPLECQVCESGIRFIGLAYNRKNILQKLSSFLEENVLLAHTFSGCKYKIQYLYKFKIAELREIEKQLGVTIAVSADGNALELKGPKNTMALCKTHLERLNNDVCSREHLISGSIKIRYINSNYHFLDQIGKKTSCVIVPDADNSGYLKLPVKKKTASKILTLHSCPLSPGKQCDVLRGDVAELCCDGIVIGTNEKLQHLSKLGAHVLQKAGDKVGKECERIMKDEQELFAWDAVRTTGGELSCSHIIHAVLPSAKSHHYQDGDLVKCFTTALMRL
ncbi:PARP14 [Bugula neritina]|uniref:PARP14 n=1 Tax=Bugula neritina TaxID=10212 RepID=A0A7J7JW14_BUGNE|nr:PARP14 [Bugula neritina]